MGKHLFPKPLPPGPQFKPLMVLKQRGGYPSKMHCRAADVTVMSGHQRSWCSGKFVGGGVLRLQGVSPAVS